MIFIFIIGLILLAAGGETIHQGLGFLLAGLSVVIAILTGKIHEEG